MFDEPLDGLTITSGVCHILYTYDVGLGIDLNECARRITALKQREQFKHKRRVPETYLGQSSMALRLSHETRAESVGKVQTLSVVDVIVHEFGAVTVNYQIDIAGPFSALLDLGHLLYENDVLRRAASREIERLMDGIGPAVAKPGVADAVEDYVIYEVQTLDRAIAPHDFLERYRLPLAQILRAERTGLSVEEIADALSCRLSFSPEDMAIVDWNAAFLLDRDAEDVRTVLELVNAELLEMRYLDRQLDDSLERAYEVLVVSRDPWRWPRSSAADLRRIARLQVDSAILFERTNNALKLIGDQYLARVYRMASQRFHLNDWDAAVQRKLQTLESIYQKITDRISTRRMEVLEWIIIILIAVSIALPFLA